jgi:ADP-ribose pyrophosphatase YjhB (NUDIX family)
LSQLLRIGAYALLLDREERILLCRIAPGIMSAQEWTLPGGGIDFGEHPRDGAIREVLEETGLVITVQDRPFVDSELFEWRGYLAHGVRLIYRGEIMSGELRHEIGGSTDRCEWFTREDAANLPLVSLGRLGIELAYASDSRLPV